MTEVYKTDFPDNGRRKLGNRRKQSRNTFSLERRRVGNDRRKKTTRRTAVRLQKQVTARFQLQAGDLFSKWDILFLRNVGPGGVLFQLGERLELGSIVKFMISFPGFGEPIPCRAKVIRIHKLPMGSLYEIAAYFTDMPKPIAAEIQQAVEKVYQPNIARIRA